MKKMRPLRFPSWLPGLSAVVLLLGAAFGVAVLRDLFGLKKMARSIVKSTLYEMQCAHLKGVVNEENPSIIFLHHSVGNNLIEQGCIRELFTQAGFTFWDHGYNEDGLRDAYGKSTGKNYAIPADNTNPDGLYALFNQPVSDPPDNAFSMLLQYDTIIFKSCYPVSNITSDELLKQYQEWYLGIRDVIDQHPDKQFVIVTTPPLNPAETDKAAAERARRFSQWLMSPEFLEGHKNIVVFDLFGQLAESDLSRPDANMLKQSYRSGSDSHPNRAANKEIAPIFVDFVVKWIGMP